MRVLDLFSGIGGFSLAAHSLGMETLAFCEREPYPVRVLNRHFPDVPVFPDVKELTADALAHAASVRQSGNGTPERTARGGERGMLESTRGDSRPLILTAGFPCQDLSYAGQGAGLGGERSGLYREVVRLVRDIQPEWVLLENVNAILTRGVGTVLGDLASCGYGWVYGCVPACAVGAPHRRDRWWAVAWPTLGDEADRHRGERIWTSVLQGLTPFGDLADGWPTATASDAWAGDHNRSQVIPCNGRVLTGKAGLGLGQAARGDTWPTPTSRDHKDGGYCENVEINALLGRAVWPTPQARDWKGESGRSLKGTERDLPSVTQMGVTGSLNPEWVETLMGYPVEWTLPQPPDDSPYDMSLYLDPLNIIRLPGLWPSGLGAEQHVWEPPRLTTVKENRANRLKALGNSIVPQVARLWLAAILEESK